MFLSRHGPGRIGPEQAHPRVTGTGPPVAGGSEHGGRIA